MRTSLVGGNWKMNTDRAGAIALADQIATGVIDLADRIEMAIYPPFVYLDAIEPAACLSLGAQDAYCEPDGAFTGEISVAMLKDCGVVSVLAGHSERRHVIGEADHLINRKVRAITDAGLQCVFCIGETREQREAGETDHINRMQLIAGLDDISAQTMRDRIVIAYEPVWAIGTGLTATPDDAQSAHAAIRYELRSHYDDETAAGVRIIYGGSVKPDNAAGLIAGEDVDGFLVGGASLNANDFIAIARAAAEG